MSKIDEHCAKADQIAEGDHNVLMEHSINI